MKQTSDPEGFERNRFNAEETSGVEIAQDELVIPIVEEYLDIGTRTVATGKVVITKTAVLREESAGVDLLAQTFDIKRIAMDKKLDKPDEVRQEGDTTIYPVMEEILIVVKQLVLKEEIHVTRRQTASRHEEVVSLQSDSVSIERCELVTEEKTGLDQYATPAARLELR